MDGRTGQDLFQQSQAEIMLFHYMQKSNFRGSVKRDRREQQCSEGIGRLYHWFIILALSLGCHLWSIGVREQLDEKNWSFQRVSEANL
jgi:hypothetical protein